MTMPASATVPLSAPRPVLFLSHAGAETEAARKLAERIEETPEARAANLKVWFDKNDLDPGHAWQEQLERAIKEQSTAFAVYVGASGVVNWVDSEVRLALSRAREERAYRFIPIISAKSSGIDALPPFAGQYQGVRNVETDDAEFAKLIRAVLNREPRVSVRLVDRPFPGLVPFDEAKSHLFFGRETETEDLVERLRRNPLLMVVGDSGSGKSSLVRAGLVPRFRGGALADRSGDRPDESVWHVVIARPRGQPFEALADAVAEAGRKVGIDAATLGTVKDWVRTERPEKVRDALLHGAPPNAKILLIVDQFEELLTQTKEPVRRPFVDALLYLVTDLVDTTVRVVLTMRQDYYNLCSQFPVLFERLQFDRGAAKYPIPRMKEEGLRACVREPLKLAGIEDSRVLEEEIVKDVGEDRASQLALVQMALSEAWRLRNEFNGDLLSAYVSRGRVAGALANAADEVYGKKLKDGERAVAQAIFIRLVQLGDTGGATRRIAARDEFSDEVWALTEKLATEDYSWLLAIRGEKGAETAELAHEAVATQWPLYRTWLENSADLKRIHDRVIPAAKKWAASGRSRRDLATGTQLDDAKKLIRERPTWFSVEERRFVERSHVAERTWAWLVRTAAVALLALVAVSISFWIAAVEQARNAAAERDRALITQSRFLADLSQQQMEGRERQQGARGSPTIGALLALEALPRDLNDPADRPLVEQAETALYRAVSQHHERLIIQHHGRLFTTGHGASVNSAAFDADGRRVVTAADDGTAKVWDAESGAHLLTLTGHGRNVFSAAFDIAGRRVVTAGSDGTARLWDAETGAQLLTLAGDNGDIRSAAFAPDGRRLVTAADDGTAKVWDAESGEELLTLTSPAAVWSAAFAPDGRRVVTAAEDGTAKLWDAKTGEELLTLTGAGKVLWSWSAAFAPDGRRVVTAAADGTAKLWDAETGEELMDLTSPDVAVWSAAFAPDGRRVVTAASDGTARLWDADTGADLLTLTGHHLEVRSAVFAPDGRRVVTAAADGTARLWDVESGAHLLTLTGHHDDVVRSAAFAPDGQRVVTAAEEGTAKLWDAESGEELLTLTGHGGWVGSAAFAPDGRRVVTAASDGTARLWDAESGEELLVLTSPDVAVWSAAFAPDGRRVVTAASDGTARLWDAESAEELLTLAGHDGVVFSAAFDATGRRVVTAAEDDTTKLWDAESGAHLLTLTGHSGDVRSAAFAPDGRRVITAADDGTAKLWDAESGEELLTLAGHGQGVGFAAFAPDGRRVVTTSWDGTARLWDAESGAHLLTLPGRDGEGWSAAFAPDGRRVVTAAADGTVRLWTVTELKQDLIDHACELLPRVVTAGSNKVELRRLTPAERKEFFLDDGENPDEAGRSGEPRPVCVGR